MNKVTEFLKQVRSELLKIEWPSYNEFVGSTIITLFIVLFFTIFIGLVDKGLGFVAKVIFSYSSW